MLRISALREPDKGEFYEEFRAYSCQMLVFPTYTEVMVSYKYSLTSGEGVVLDPALLWETRAALAWATPGQKAGGAHCGEWKGTRNTGWHKAPTDTSTFFSSLICFANWQGQVAQPCHGNPILSLNSQYAFRWQKTWDFEQNF